ncbi:MAG: endonuclease III [Actinomycetota bacterium]|nr:endonuclease III [Actinomycetota bacterium]
MPSVTTASAPRDEQRRRARLVLNRLTRRYPQIGTALEYQNVWQLLVVTVLSAQTLDDTVNRVAPEVFARWPQPEDLAAANPEEVEAVIYPTGFYRQKTKSIIGLAQAIGEHHGGVVPDDLDTLTELPGVGRKTASVVLAEAWDKPAIAVDTHVHRVSRRLELTANDQPVKIEADLKALYPKRRWSGISMRFIKFGREVCDAKRPRCWECPLRDLCPWPDKRPAPAAIR